MRVFSGPRQLKSRCVSSTVCLSPPKLNAKEDEVLEGEELYKKKTDDLENTTDLHWTVFRARNRHLLH